MCLLEEGHLGHVRSGKASLTRSEGFALQGRESQVAAAGSAATGFQSCICFWTLLSPEKGPERQSSLIRPSSPLGNQT